MFLFFSRQNYRNSTHNKNGEIQLFSYRICWFSALKPELLVKIGLVRPLMIRCIQDTTQSLAVQEWSKRINKYPDNDDYRYQRGMELVKDKKFKLALAGP